MRFKFRQKYIITLFLVLFYCLSPIFGQLKNFGTTAKIKPEPNYLFSVYGYADIVREYGIGFQYQLFAKYNLDFSAYLISPNTYFKNIIRQWDYYDLKGYGISFKPKYQFSKLSSAYVGFNFAYEKLYHQKVWVDYSYSDDYELFALEEAKGSAYTIGITFGNRITYKHFLIDPFLGIGYTTSNIIATTYEVSGQNVNPNYNYNQTYKPKHDYFQMNIGIKFGLSFKKNKKHIAIDKKFDETYIPKSISLMNYFKTVDTKKIESNKYLRTSYRRTKSLNHSVLWRYKNNYADTANFYKKVDILFQKIDSLIIKGNQ